MSEYQLIKDMIRKDFGQSVCAAFLYGLSPDEVRAMVEDAMSAESSSAEMAIGKMVKDAAKTDG